MLNNPWEIKKLSDVTDINMGQSPLSKDCNDNGEGLPFFQGNADFGYMYPRATKHCMRPKKVAEEGDILISVRAPVGDINIANTKSAIGRGLSAIRAVQIERGFLYYYLQFYKPNWANVQQGSTFEAINKADLTNLEIPLPPPEEQRKISAILTSVDEAIEKTETIITQTEKVKKGLMQELLTKGIEHTKFKESEIGQMPEEWRLGKLKDYTAHITKGATPTTYGYDWVTEGILFLRNECIKERGLNLKGSARISAAAHQTMRRSVIKKGDILISITGNLGQSCIYNLNDDANINQHIARVRVIDQNIVPKFVKHYLNSDYMRKQYELIRTGLAYPQLSLKQIQDTIFPIPSVREQKKIVDILSSIEDKEKNEKKKLLKYQLLKKGLMQDLLTSKVRVKVDGPEVVSS